MARRQFIVIVEAPDELSHNLVGDLISDKLELCGFSECHIHPVNITDISLVPCPEKTKRKPKDENKKEKAPKRKTRKR